MAPKLSTVHVASPTGSILQIRPIDPEFWSSGGNINVQEYIDEHEKYLASRRESGDVVYHYTSLDAFHGIISDGVIWASDARMLNDRFEVHYALEHMQAVLAEDKHASGQPLDAIFRPSRAVQFVTCLSRSRDQLSQWRAYGKRVGIAIGFDREHLTRAVAKRNGSIVDCRYLWPHEFVGLRKELDPIVQALGAPGVLNADGALVDTVLQKKVDR